MAGMAGGKNAYHLSEASWPAPPSILTPIVA